MVGATIQIQIEIFLKNMILDIFTEMEIWTLYMEVSTLELRKVISNMRGQWYQIYECKCLYFS